MKMIMVLLAAVLVLPACGESFRASRPLLLSALAATASTAREQRTRALAAGDEAKCVASSGVVAAASNALFAIAAFSDDGTLTALPELTIDLAECLGLSPDGPAPLGPEGVAIASQVTDSIPEWVPAIVASVEAAGGNCRQKVVARTVLIYLLTVGEEVVRQLGDPDGTIHIAPLAFDYSEC